MDENQIIEDNTGLIITVAKSLKPADQNTLDEYIQAGRIGLLKAIRSYDPSRGTFSNAAWNYIKWEILTYIKKEKSDNFLPITINPSGTFDEDEDITNYLPNTLSDREKNVVLLRNQGYSFKNIGEENGYSKSWANYVFHSGIQKIKDANKIYLE